MTLDRHLRQVDAALRGLEPLGTPAQHAAYIGGGESALEYLGLKVPQVDAVARAGFPFLAGDAKAVLAVWDHVWRKSDCYEVMSLPIGYYAHKKRWDQLPEVFPRLKTWARRIDNWAHSDGLSSIYARTLEADRALVLPTLDEWGDAKNPWLRRQSIVSLLYYSSARDPKRILPFGTIKGFVERQIDVDHYYVQKGVGWTLRELGNVYPDKTLAYLRANIERISAAAFASAAEKLAPAVRTELKARRKAARGARA